MRCVNSAGLGPARSLPDRRAIGTIYGIVPTADIVGPPPSTGLRVDLFAAGTDARMAFDHARATAAEQQAGNAIVIVGVMTARQLERLDQCVFGTDVRPVSTHYRLY
jgi:hypothetical protein